MSKKLKDKTSTIIIVVLVAILAIVGISLIVRASQSQTKTLGALDYQIGSLDESGKFVKDTSSIVTKNFLSTDKMSIEIAKDANVTYKVFFFDKNEVFISADETANSADYVGTIPENAALFKVVITPTKDAEVSTLEIGNYAKQLTVSCAK